MNAPIADIPSERLQDVCADVARVRQALEQVIVGQSELIQEIVICILAGGHVLMDGLPGLGKTHLAKALAASLGLPLARVQCTPDLMPADITGGEVMVNSDDQRGRHLSFRQGPIFSAMVLVDEINRAMPKTQAALLEAMQESQVTYAGVSYALPKPFCVIATQNPIELEGTFPLPEAQLDRFLFKVVVRYPTAAALSQIVSVSLDDEPADRVSAVLSVARVLEMTACAREMVIAEPVKQAAIRLIVATQPRAEGASPVAGRHLRYGASPRGLQALLRTARLWALSEGRGHVALADLKAVALPALRHRILLNVEAEMEGIETDQILGEILHEWERVS